MQQLAVLPTQDGHYGRYSVSDPGVQLVPQASVPATDYAQYMAIRDKFKRGALGQLEPAIRVSTVAALDTHFYPVNFCNQGALGEWECLFKAHDWSQGMWDPWSTARSTCLDCFNKLCWQVDQHLHPHLRSQRPPGWPDAAFATVVRWAANKRLTAVGPKKQAKLQRHIASLYDRITVGPASAPALPPGVGTAGIKAPHWRRGHFRAQPCSPARNSRKLLFVAPILIHADQLSGQAPPPKAYALTTGRAQPPRAAVGQQQTKRRLKHQERA